MSSFLDILDVTTETIAADSDSDSDFSPPPKERQRVDSSSDYLESDNEAPLLPTTSTPIHSAHGSASSSSTPVTQPCPTTPPSANVTPVLAVFSTSTASLPLIAATKNPIVGSTLDAISLHVATVSYPPSLDIPVSTPDDVPSTSAASLSDTPLPPVTASSTPTPPSTNSTSTSAVEVTPHSEPSSTSTELTRKRKRNPENWKKVKKSKTYNSGTKKIGQISVQRTLGPRCECKRKECAKISEVARQRLLNVFWSETSDKKFRQNYINTHTTQHQKKSAATGAKRKRGNHIEYFLTVDTTTYKVCQKFFLSTLNVSTRMILYNLERSKDGVRIQPAKRKPHNKISEEIHRSVSEHIRSFPSVESHYCRSDTKRNYLESQLNIREMHRLYKAQSANNTAREHYYRQVFNTEFNLGFHKPSKDQCDACDTFKKLRNPTTVQSVEHESHLRRKQQAYQAKDSDKNIPTEEGKLAVTFDLQQVLTVPRIFAGSAYYKRKLNTYNLTFYELQTKMGHCYYWTEAEACRGANDIATAIVMYLEKVDATERYKEVVLYSDTCGGQNRNKICITAILSFLSSAKTIKKVSQKFFESGHSHMECDSMHSTIESAAGFLEIEIPSDYINILKTARKSGEAYHVTELGHGQFRDYGGLNGRAMVSQAFKGIMQVHHITYEAVANGDPVVTMSKEIGGEAEPIAYRKRGAPVSLSVAEAAYELPIGITAEKKRDLLSMIPHFTNQTMARLYYNSLVVLSD